MTQATMREASLTHWAAVNVAAWRKSEGLSQQALADRVAALGVSMSRATIANLESRRRGDLTLDEVAALAAALNVRVPDLLTPPDLTEDVAVLPARTVSGFQAIDWVTGEAPLMTEHPADYKYYEYFRHAPAGVRATAAIKHREAWRAIEMLKVDTLHALLGVADEYRAGVAHDLEDGLRRVDIFIRELARTLRTEPTEDRRGER